jgi:hypothetical protein
MTNFKNVLQIKVALKDFKPSIYRTFYFSADSDFLELHAAIQEIMGWDSSHLFCFRKGRDINIGVPFDNDFGFYEVLDISKTKLKGFLEFLKNNIIYEYDFGDGWEHKVEVQKVFEEIELSHLPFCKKGANACPIEDCGGVWGYQNILEVMLDKKNPEYKEMNQWYDFKNLNLWEFDVNEVNEELKDFKAAIKYHKDVVKEMLKSN